MAKPSRKSLKAKADRIFSKHIRSIGKCEAEGYGPVNCSPRLETMHVISRRYAHTRTDEANAYCGCSAHHHWFTDHPIEWSKFVIGKIGEEAYQELLRRSQRRDKFDWAAEVERLEHL